MTEYRIVCDGYRTLENGVKKRFVARPPRTRGGDWLTETKDRAIAEATLPKIAEACAVYEKEFRETARLCTPGSCADLVQFNIRIQSREVTEWTDN